MTSWTPGKHKGKSGYFRCLGWNRRVQCAPEEILPGCKAVRFWGKLAEAARITYIVYLTVRICEDPISSTDYPGTIHDIELHTKYNPYIAEPFYRKCHCLFCRIAMGNCSASNDTCFKEQMPCLAPRANAMRSLAQSPDGLDLQLLVASCGYLISELQRARKIAGIGFNFPFTMFQLFQVVSANTGRCL